MVAFYIISGLLIIFSFIHLVKYQVWWIRVFDFIHIQLAFFLSLTLGIGMLTLPLTLSIIILLSLLFITLLYHLWLVIPFTVFHKKQVLDKALNIKSKSVSAMVSNVYQHNTQYDKLLEIVKNVDPDILLFVETDALWESALSVLERNFPYKISYPLENTYGMILYSKLTIENSKICFLVEDDVPSFEVTVSLPSGVQVDLYTTHPQPPSPTENERSTERDAELLQIAKKVKSSNRPTLVMGDLNDVAWSHTTRLFKRISGLLDPRIGRGSFNTFHAKIPFMRFPLDHIFSSHHFTLGRIERLPFCNSDHFPIFIELFYEPSLDSEENQVDADHDDHQEANEKIAKV